MKQLEQIKHFIQSSNAIQLVIGPAGAGKSALLRQVIEQADTSQPIVYFSGRVPMKIDAMVETTVGNGGGCISTVAACAG